MICIICIQFGRWGSLGKGLATGMLEMLQNSRSISWLFLASSEAVVGGHLAYSLRHGCLEDAERLPRCTSHLRRTGRGAGAGFDGHGCELPNFGWRWVCILLGRHQAPNQLALVCFPSSWMSLGVPPILVITCPDHPRSLKPAAQQWGRP